MPPVSSSARHSRLEARVSPVQKALFQQAAALAGKTLSDLVVESTQAAATRIVREHELIQLTREEQMAFATALLDPQPATPALMQAAKSYRQGLEVDI